ncbi:sialate O-acetylesterase [Belliella kenyensis]|uniref:Sialate O-acetylesterase n=2 Tax=Belliella kenyensis TaxID=1472724 RepID=A0ABV8EQZ3_9BACT|nr:sialate O-acetylesterase [Belliella kenyensis]
MVIQRNADVNIWGWADAKAVVKVSFDQVDFEAKADQDGRWHLVLPTKNAGGPFEMIISSNGDEKVIQDIWIGEVWVCSGQSNMETTMERIEPMFPEEFIAPDNNLIRYFDVPDDYSFIGIKEDLKGGKWVSVTPESIKSIAAVSYFFAKNISNKYGLAVGMINASVGGSPIEAWLSEDALREFPKDHEEALHFQKPGIIEEIETNDRDKMNEWRTALNQNDLGLQDGQIPWYDEHFQPKNWLSMDEVGLWPTENGRPVNGVYWFRKEFNIDDDFIGQRARLLLGTLIDSDQAYVNGVLVGSTSYQYPPRRYDVPKEVLKFGKNTLVVRIVNESGRGGFVKDKPYRLEIGDTIIDLSTDWLYQVGATSRPAPRQTAVRFKPMGLYNAMIAPLQSMTIQGVLWYQGESNVGQATKYEKQLNALLHSWRSSWSDQDLPFILVQLPNFMETSELPQESAWAEMRNVQRKALKYSNVGLAITIDVGEANDIHPLDKKTVGDRLALQAYKIAYNESNGPFSGPLLKNVEKTKRSIILEFTEVGRGLQTLDNQKVAGFSISIDGENYDWVTNAKLVGNSKVIIPLNKGQIPESIRYAWANNPHTANLINAIGIPASPFQHDFR